MGFKSAFFLLFFLFFTSLFADTDSSQPALTSFVEDPAPWLRRTADSEQRQPLYIGSTPREFCLGLTPKDAGKVLLYEILRVRGEEQAGNIRNALVKKGGLSKDATLQLEAWPVRDEFGQLTWAFARWRQGRDMWKWLDASLVPEPHDVYLVRSPFLPVKMDPRKKEDFHLIFDDVLKLKGLYDKPLFGDCIWTEEGEQGKVFEAWVPVDRMEEYGAKNKFPVCRVLPQPARLNGKPVEFFLSVRSDDKVIWPESISWKKEITALPELPGSGLRIKAWPKDFISAYKNDILALDGEREAVFPITKRKVIFKNKNNIDKANQLQDLVAYLEERYKILGLKTLRQDFTWRGMKQTNLIAVIPGTDPGAKPVLMADHIDTAFCEDIYAKTGKRISAPGADDNNSATAVLLRAAEVLKDTGPKHDIWLVHFTGEEFPPDDLGATYFVTQLLKDKIDIEGLVLIDMIGHREKGSRIFQINPGDSQESLRMAKIAFDAAGKITEFEPVLRTRFDEKSFLYNMDGLIFSEYGFPVLFLNEHMNKLENMYRKGYHHSTDTSQKIDWDYAADIAKVAIETVAVTADARQAPVSVRARQPDWSIMLYVGIDEPDLAKAFNPRLKELLQTPVPDNLEVLIERDTDQPDGSARIIRRSDSYEEYGLPEQDSASAATLGSFLKWAKGHSAGKHKLLIVQSHSWGWRGIVQDYTVPGQKDKNTMMALRDFASAARASGLRPDVIVFDACVLGNAEPIEEFKDLAPYLIASELELPYNGFPTARLFKMLSSSEMSPREFARVFPEEYVKEYAHDGSMVVPENEYFIVTFASIDTAKWDIFSGRFKELVDKLKVSGFRDKLAAQPGWVRAFADEDTNADIVEFLNRLPLLVDDAAVKAAAASILDDIGYPKRVADENAATIRIDPANIGSFELRIEVYPYLQQGRVLRDIQQAWREANQDLDLPAGLTCDLADIGDGRNPGRELIVRCPEGVLKKPVELRPWLAGAKYIILKTFDRKGRATERKLTKGKDYFSVRKFPETSFMISEAHNQGAPFIHGVGLVLNPGMKPEFERSRDPATGLSGPAFYRTTAWNKRTGWGDLTFIESAEPLREEHVHQ